MMETDIFMSLVKTKILRKCKRTAYIYKLRFFRTNAYEKGMNSLIPKIVPLLFFYKDGFGLKEPTKVDMPLNKESKSKLLKRSI